MTDAEFAEMAQAQDDEAVVALQMLPSIMHPKAWFELSRAASNVDSICWHLANPNGEPLCEQSVIDEIAEIRSSLERVSGVLRSANI